jgi:hypothetical protein
MEVDPHQGSRRLDRHLTGILFLEDTLPEDGPAVARYGLTVTTVTAKILKTETIEDVVTVLGIARRRVSAQPSGMHADASCVGMHTCWNDLIVIQCLHGTEIFIGSQTNLTSASVRASSPGLSH